MRLVKMLGVAVATAAAVSSGVCLKGGVPAVGAPQMLRATPSPYHLDTVCQGDTFFDCFEFDTPWTCVVAGGHKVFNSKSVDCSEGPTYYVSKEEAVNKGIVEVADDYTVIRAGGLTPNPDNRTTLNHFGALVEFPYLRESVRLQSKKSWKYMLLVMKFEHLPFGCGTWPAFWTLGPGQWPNGGELDIMEWGNLHLAQKSSLHTVQNCTLKPQAVNTETWYPDTNGQGYNCYTQYPDHIGCAPGRTGFVGTGPTLGPHPGVFAMQWTAGVIKVFYFPENEIPKDLDTDSPQPHTWPLTNVISYYPLKESAATCEKYADVLQPQSVRLNQAFCGDWAEISGWWGQGCDFLAYKTLPAGTSPGCNDFILSPTADEYLKENAFWNITYIKIFKDGESDAL